MAQQDVYYVPHGSKWPIIGAVALFCTFFGLAHWLDGIDFGEPLFFVGLAILIFMLFGWFGTVIRESLSGTFNGQVDVSFRMGMVWFIFSEVMFFGAFFGALFYTRIFTIPWQGGHGHGVLTNYFLWDGFTSHWPTNGPANVGGAFRIASPWKIPLINTLLLLSSAVTITIAHYALKDGKRRRLLVFQALTIFLGAFFLAMQAHEYMEAYTHFNLTLESGIYGATFFMLTGFHGLHVTLGTIMLITIWFRCRKGHFTKENHFAYEAVAWYWHFVDVVWLGLFLFVYIL